MLYLHEQAASKDSSSALPDGECVLASLLHYADIAQGKRHGCRHAMQGGRDSQHNGPVALHDQLVRPVWRREGRVLQQQAQGSGTGPGLTFVMPVLVTPTRPDLGQRLA